jgi:hypothetical protein
MRALSRIGAFRLAGVRIDTRDPNNQGAGTAHIRHLTICRVNPIRKTFTEKSGSTHGITRTGSAEPPPDCVIPGDAYSYINKSSSEEIDMPTCKGGPRQGGRQDRIDDLKRRVNKIAGGEMISSSSAACPPEIEEKFLEQVLAFEEAATASLFDQLVQAGVTLPPPDELSDSGLTSKLWEAIRGLAELGTFLHSTNHMSDRELYTRLWHDSLRVPEPVLPEALGYQTHIDFVSSGSEEDIQTYLRYYADEASRRAWREEWSDVEMPEHEEPPYDRDDHLPGAGW